MTPPATAVEVIDLTFVDGDSPTAPDSHPQTSSRRRDSKHKKRKPDAGTLPTINGGGKNRAEVIELVDDEEGDANGGLPFVGPAESGLIVAGRNGPAPPLASNDLFYIDITPNVVPHSVSSGGLQRKNSEPETKLLLPTHVTVIGGVPVEILRPPDMDIDGDDYIEYLDYDDRKDMVRYFDTEPTTPKATRIVCKHCGAEGEHKTALCTVVICLTCGARNEHSTRSCPISKTCFSCGMKGHINSSCPYRYGGRPNNNRFDDCQRCGSQNHQTNECPTLWRLYEYLADAQRADVIGIRQSRKDLEIGEGGEGYIAEDEWCYNCGNSGHWGDDCTDVPHIHDFPREPSAFSIFNTSTGPFSDVVPGKVARGPRTWEQPDELPDGWGQSAPQQVGKRGKRREMEMLEKKQREVEDNDPDDWFGSAGRGRANGKQEQKRLELDNGRRAGDKKMTFGISLKGAAHRLQDAKPSHDESNGRSLLSRLGDGYNEARQGNGSRSHQDDRNSKWREGDRNGRHHGRDTGRDRERDRPREHERDFRGPRYRGGYGR